MLIRGAAVLDVPARLRPGTGCFLVSVADGPDRQRILRSAALEPARGPMAEPGATTARGVTPASARARAWRRRVARPADRVPTVRHTANPGLRAPARRRTVHRVVVPRPAVPAWPPCRRCCSSRTWPSRAAGTPRRADDDPDRHRQPHRRLLRVRAVPGGHPQPGTPRRTGQRGDHRRLGGERPTRRLRRGRAGLHPGRRAAHQYDGKSQVEAVARVYDDQLHLVTTSGGPVRTVADLRGRRVSVGAPGSGTEITATRLLEVALPRW